MLLTDRLTPTWLKERYLYGIDLTDDLGEPYPDELFEIAIATAISELEIELDLSLRPQVVTDEPHDFRPQDLGGWSPMSTHKRPLSSLTAFQIKIANYPPAGVPLSWLRIMDAGLGRLHVMPSMDAPLVGIGVTLWHTPYIDMPGYWLLSYVAGYDEDTNPVPDDITHAIGLKASILPLDTAGDLIVGAGIASKSYSQGGISESINTTSSATNAGYGARIISYRKTYDVLLPLLRAKYRRRNFGAV